MTGGWVGISEIKLGFCYVPMPGILPVSESGRSWRSVSVVTLISVSHCFKFWLKLVVTFKQLHAILAISFCGHHSERN